jgi:hypothetical protein
MNPLPEIKAGKYRHFKGKEYRLLYVARHSETLEPMVVYQALYGEMGIWVRPAACGPNKLKRTGSAWRALPISKSEYFAWKRGKTLNGLAFAAIVFA